LNHGLNLSFIRPGRALDQLSLSSHPEVLLNLQQIQRSRPQVGTRSARATPIHQVASTSGDFNGKHGLSVTQRMVQAEATEAKLIALGEDPAMIREVVAPLTRPPYSGAL
jgi:hypothetical protein